MRRLNITRRSVTRKGLVDDGGGAVLLRSTVYVNLRNAHTHPHEHTPAQDISAPLLRRASYSSHVQSGRDIATWVA